METKPDPDPLLNRLGKFRLAPSQLRANPSFFLPFLSQVVVVQTEFCFAIDRIEFTGYSLLFERIPEFVMPPQYDVLLVPGDGTDEKPDVWTVKKL